MNALELRDECFSQLHGDSLKALGFKKRGHWSIREVNGLAQCFYLRASRFGSKVEAVFWIDVQVFNEAWHNLVFRPLPYSGPTEGKPSLLTQQLGGFCEPPRHSLKLSSQAELAVLSGQLLAAAKNAALPLLESCSTLDGLVRYWLARPASAEGHLICAGLYRMLSHDAKARAAIAKAKTLAAHENELRWLE